MELVIIVLGLLVDRITKLWALKDLSESEGISVIDNFFSLNYLENRGAAFGVFQNKVFLLSAVTFVVILGMIYYVIKNRKKSKLLSISLSLIISGALGNLYDRVFYKYVVDFIRFYYKDVYEFPTFNVADMLVVVGTFLLAIYIIKEE